MTLVPFPPETLDDLALRLLDVAAKVRQMSVASRENAVVEFELHGNKVREWLQHLEGWAHDGAARLETIVIRQRGARRARGAVPPAPAATPAKPVKKRKKTR
jgi:hypothetical protein